MVQCTINPIEEMKKKLHIIDSDRFGLRTSDFGQGITIA